MSRVFYIAIALIWMASAPVSAWAGDGRIVDAAGSVSVAVGKEPPRRALKNDPVTSGTVIRTGDNSYAVLKFEDGQVANLEANTTFKVREYAYDPQQLEKNNIVFSMFKGGMRFVSGLIGKRNPQSFRLATPNSTIGIRGTDFLAVMKNGQIYIKVLSGSVTMTTSAGTVTLVAGEIAAASAAAVPSIIPAAAIPADTFIGATAINLEEALAAQAAAASEAAAIAASEAAAAASEAAAAAAAADAAAAASGAAAGGAATGGAAMAGGAAAAGGAAVSATTIAIGVGVAAGVAALVNTTSTTQH